MLLLCIILLATFASVRSEPCAGVGNGVFLPDPSGDCQTYLSCSNGVSFPMRCPDGFLFDNQRQMCNFPDQVTCGNPCQGKPDYTFIPRPDGGCEAYYSCSQGQSVPMTCPNGLHFDPVNLMCNYPELVNCGGTTTTTTTITTTTTGGVATTTTTGGVTTTVTPSTPGTTTTSSANPGTTTTTIGTPPTTPGPPCFGGDGIFVKDSSGDCQDYFACVQGVPFRQRCPTGFFFDEPNQNCNHWDMVACGNPTDPCYGKPQNSFVPRPSGTCSSYYRCEFGVGIPLDCPNGLFFDEVSFQCNHPDLVTCEDTTQPTAPTVPTTTTIATTTTTTGTTTIPTAPTAPPTTRVF
jgi:Chitin binding Peritrophin-A domain